MTLRTTGVGSVPFASPDEAVEHVFREYTLPFFPQVIRAGGAPAGTAPMLWEILTPRMATATAADAAAKLQGLPGLPAFLARLGDGDEAKTQLVGPETMAALLGQHERDAAWHWCTLVTEAWVALLRTRTRAHLVVIWDEGLLLASGAEAVQRFRTLQARLALQGVSLGLHTCAPCEVTTLVGAFPDAVLSVDAHVSDLLTPRGLAAAAGHAARGGRWIVGAVDTRPGALADEDSAARIAAAVSSFAFALSGGCGTGLRTEADERSVARTLRRVAGAAHVLQR